MSLQPIAWIIIGLALVAANLPWLTERFFFVLTPPGGGKKAWMRLLEWAALLIVVGLISLGFEKKTMGNIHVQEWEFFVIGVCLFTVFALPGFIYRHDLLKLLKKR